MVQPGHLRPRIPDGPMPRPPWLRAPKPMPNPDSRDPSEDDRNEALVKRAKSGDREAEKELIGKIYAALHGIAQRLMRRQRRDITLQVTELVNEALLKLFTRGVEHWPDTEGEMIILAARAMKQVLTDHARRKMRQKRCPAGERMMLDDLVAYFESRSYDLVALGDALDRLEARDPVAARLVYLRFFVGLGIPEAAKVLGVSDRTAERDWRSSRAWLRREILG